MSRERRINYRSYFNYRFIFHLLSIITTFVKLRYVSFIVKLLLDWIGLNFCVSVSAKDTNNAHALGDFYSFPVTRRDYENLDMYTGRPMSNEQMPTPAQTEEREKYSYNNNNLYCQIKPPDFYEYKLPHGGATRV